MKFKRLLDFDCPECSKKDAAIALGQVIYSNTIDSLKSQYNDARSLLDGCYEVVELFDPETPSQAEWKQKWLEGARKHGASGL